MSEERADPREIPAGVVCREAQARPLAIEHPAHGLEHDGFVAGARSRK
ncbi:MAG: hypothetical protein ACYCVU_05280 [Gammaproteobacteria bacterium]